MLERLEVALNVRGFEVSEEKNPLFDKVIKVAEIETKRGMLRVIAGISECKITARVDKPNGTSKWLYQRSEAQILRAIDQTLKFNN